MRTARRRWQVVRGSDDAAAAAAAAMVAAAAAAAAAAASRRSCHPASGQRRCHGRKLLRRDGACRDAERRLACVCDSQGRRARPASPRPARHRATAGPRDGAQLVLRQHRPCADPGPGRGALAARAGPAGPGAAAEACAPPGAHGPERQRRDGRRTRLHGQARRIRRRAVPPPRALLLRSGHFIQHAAAGRSDAVRPG